MRLFLGSNILYVFSDTTPGVEQQTEVQMSFTFKHQKASIEPEIIKPL